MTGSRCERLSDKLSEVTPDKLRDFAEQAAALLKSLGYTDAKVNGRGEAVEKVHLDAPVNLELDTPINIERARTWLRGLVDHGDVATEGQAGDDRTYQVACGLRDLGLSAKTAWEVTAGARRLERTLPSTVGA